MIQRLRGMKKGYPDDLAFLKIGMLPKRVPSDLVFFKFSMDAGKHVPKIRVFLARVRCKFTSFRDSDEYRNI